MNTTTFTFIVDNTICFSDLTGRAFIVVASITHIIAVMSKKCIAGKSLPDHRVKLTTPKIKVGIFKFVEFTGIIE